MSPNAVLLLVVSILAGLGVVFGALIFVLRRRLAGVERALREAHGDQVERADPCYFIVGHSRVPGVLAMLQDGAAWRATIVHATGSARFAEIRGFRMERARDSADPRFRKSGCREVLALTVSTGVEIPAFALKDEVARRWRRRLEAVG